MIRKKIGGKHDKNHDRNASSKCRRRIGPLFAMSLGWLVYRNCRSMIRLERSYQDVDRQWKPAEAKSKSASCRARRVRRRGNHSAFIAMSASSFVSMGEFYSGMWWQPIESMLLVDYGSATFLEQVSLITFAAKSDSVLQTQDWLDLVVEHLSKYVKHFDFLEKGGRGVATRAQDRLVELLDAYINKTLRSCGARRSPYSAISRTIAVLPLRVPTSSKDGGNSYSARITATLLASTLASLWKIGIPRAVVVGVSPDERVAADEAFLLLRRHVSLRPMDLNFVMITNATDQGRKLVPRLAMMEFQHAYREYLEEPFDGRANGHANGHTNAQPNPQSNHISSLKANVRSWLGTNPSQWKHIYFSEPDLILHTRPQFLPVLSDALNKGNILNAHRLQPLPHMQQFQDIFDDICPLAVNTTAENPIHTSFNCSGFHLRKLTESQLLPNLPPFTSIHSLDPYSGETCYDQGRYYPAHQSDVSTPEAVRKTSSCSNIWSFCGFPTQPDFSETRATFRQQWQTLKMSGYGNLSTVVKRHRRLLQYQLISLKEGTGVPLVHAGQRSCIPNKDG